MKLCVFLGLLALHFTTSGWSQGVARPQERALEDFLADVSKSELETLDKNQDEIQCIKIAQALSKTLQDKEAGKKWTLKFNKGGNPVVTRENKTVIYNTLESGLVQVSGIPVHVRVQTEIPPAMTDKVKKWRLGDKIFVSGTVTELRFFSGLSKAGAGKNQAKGASFALHISVVADDLGLDR
jgi:hypothetical protein